MVVPFVRSIFSSLSLLVLSFFVTSKRCPSDNIKSAERDL